MADLDKYLKFLYENDAGFVYSPVKTKQGDWETHWFQWPSQEEKLKDHILFAKEYGNVYVAPALFSAKTATKEHVLHTNVAWIEFDGQNQIAFNGIPQPDMVVQTSTDTHQHCFWKIEKTGSSAVEDVNRRLTYHLQADGSGWDSTQVLRPPDTTNWKNGLPVRLVKYEVPILKHKLFIFDNAPTVVSAPSLITYDDLEPVEKIIPRYNLPESLVRMITTEIAVEPHRSTFLMRSGFLLASAGLTEVEIVACLFNIDHRVKKFVGRSDQLRRLSEIASIALLQVVSTKIESYSPLDIINHQHDLTWLVDGWLHDRGIMLVSGSPGVGKTQFVLHMAFALTTGSKFLDKKVTKPVKVMFLSLEMSILELKYIFKHQYTEWVEDEKHHMWLNAFQTYSPDEVLSLTEIEKLIKECDPDVLIIDSLSELAVDDLKETEARRIMSWVRRVRTVYSTAVILIHHNRKASTGNAKPRKLSDLYGSFIFGKLSETVVSLWDTERDSVLELDILKARFGSKDTIKFTRSANLTFTKVTNVNRNPGPTGDTNPLLGFLTK
jgi:KaiC/GvpD/RAD55 family RecA-like ATPase